MRKMPYDFVYRGLAAAIGLLLWMFLTAIVVFLGAAYNAEVRETVEAEQRLTASTGAHAIARTRLPSSPVFRKKAADLSPPPAAKLLH